MGPGDSSGSMDRGAFGRGTVSHLSARPIFSFEFTVVAQPGDDLEATSREQVA